MKCKTVNNEDGNGAPMQKCERVMQRWKQCRGMSSPELVEEKREEFEKNPFDVGSDLTSDFGVFGRRFGFGRNVEDEDSDFIATNTRRIFNNFHRGLFDDFTRNTPSATGSTVNGYRGEYRHGPNDDGCRMEFKVFDDDGIFNPFSSFIDFFLTPQWGISIRRLPRSAMDEHLGRENDRYPKKSNDSSNDTS